MPKIRLFVPNGDFKVARFYEPEMDGDKVTGFSKTKYNDVPLHVIENTISGFKNLIVFLSTAVYATNVDGTTSGDEPVGRLLTLEVSQATLDTINIGISDHFAKQLSK